jgi:hypothetical protein
MGYKDYGRKVVWCKFEFVYSVESGSDIVYKYEVGEGG